MYKRQRDIRPKPAEAAQGRAARQAGARACLSLARLWPHPAARQMKVRAPSCAEDSRGFSLSQTGETVRPRRRPQARNHGGTASLRAAFPLCPREIKSTKQKFTAHAIRHDSAVPVSYTHLDVYKRQATPAATASPVCRKTISPPLCRIFCGAMRWCLPRRFISGRYARA